MVLHFLRSAIGISGEEAAVSITSNLKYLISIPVYFILVRIGSKVEFVSTFSTELFSFCYKVSLFTNLWRIAKCTYRDFKKPGSHTLGWNRLLYSVH